MTALGIGSTEPTSQPRVPWLHSRLPRSGSGWGAWQIEVQIGDVVRVAREKRGMSVEDLAAKSGVDRSYLHSLENGRWQPTIRTLSRLAPVLGMTIEQMMAKPISIPPDKRAALSS